MADNCAMARCRRDGDERCVQPPCEVSSHALVRCHQDVKVRVCRSVIIFNYSYTRVMYVKAPFMLGNVVYVHKVIVEKLELE
jgi:hypothetical protein